MLGIRTCDPHGYFLIMHPPPSAKIISRLGISKEPLLILDLCPHHGNIHQCRESPDLHCAPHGIARGRKNYFHHQLCKDIVVEKLSPGSHLLRQLNPGIAHLPLLRSFLQLVMEYSFNLFRTMIGQKIVRGKKDEVN